MKLTLWFRKLGSALLTGLRRFPFAVLISVAITFVILWLNHWSNQMGNAERDDWTRALMVLILGFPIVLGVHLMLERGQKAPTYKPVGVLWRVLAFVPVAAGLTAYAWFLLPVLDDIPIIRLIMLTASAVLIFVFTPYWWRREGIALHSTRLLTRSLVTILYAGILMMSLFAILFTLENLLNVNIKDDHYADTATFVWALFAPLFFMAGIPGIREVPTQADSPKTLRFLMHYILIPLLWVYTAILYVYSAKILIEREWPRGMVSSLILAYLCVGLLIWLLSSPVREDTKIAVFHHRWFAWSALPLFGILFTALFIRINEYGFTEERWFAFLLAVWCAFAILFLAIRSLFLNKNPEAVGLRLIVLPVTLAALAISSVVGPFSAFAISVRSQNRQFEQLLDRNGMLVAGQAVPAEGTLSKDDQSRMVSILYWFEETDRLPEVDSLPALQQVSQAAAHLALSLDETYPDTRYQYVQLISEAEAQPVDIAGYDLLVEIGYNDNLFTDTASGLSFRMDQQIQELRVTKAGEPLMKWDTSGLLQPLVEKYGDGAPLGELRIPKEAMTFDREVDGTRFRLHLVRLGGNLSPDASTRDKYTQGWLLVDLP